MDESRQDTPPNNRVAEIIKAVYQKKLDETRKTPTSPTEQLDRRLNKLIADALGTYDLEDRLLADDIRRAISINPELPKYAIVSSEPIEDHLRERIKGGQNMALWFLFATGELENAVNKTVSRDASDDDKLAAAIKIGSRFIELIDQRNREVPYWNNPYLPTIGLEVEFPITRLSHSDLLRLRRQHNLGGKSDQYMGDKLGILSQSQKQRNISDDVFNYKNEIIFPVREVALKPTASPTTQLRTLLLMQKEGSLPSSMNIHINIGGLMLDQDHAQAMIITSMVFGAAFQSPFFSKQGLPLTIYEKIQKLSLDDRIYPLHRDKGLEFSNKYKKGYRHNTIEFRGICHFNSFSNQVRAVESTYWLATAARAKQLLSGHGVPSEQEDPTLKALTTIWDETEIEWLLLLTKYHISLKNKKSILENPTDELLSDGCDTPYNKAIAKIAYLAEKYPRYRFRKEAREIIIKARARIKAEIRKTMPPNEQAVQEQEPPHLPRTFSALQK